MCAIREKEPLRLSDQELEVRAPRELCFEVVASAGRVLERRPDGGLVVGFTTQRDGATVRTVELLVLNRPTSISYRWLEGPLPDVTETIFFDELDATTTLLRYEGRFSTGRGVLSAVIGRVKIKPIFDRLVREHLLEAKSVSERRAARSRLYPAAASEPRRQEDAAIEII